jgi:predicted DNA-binding protein YlxM (UPF0122 family)
MAKRGAPANTTLTAPQKKALEFFLRGYSMNRIAAMLNVTIMTVHLWCKKEHFRQALNEAIESVDFTNGIDIRHLVSRSYEELDGLLQDPSPAIRLGACRLSLEAYTRMIAINEDKAAINALEQRLEQLQVLASQQVDAMAGDAALALPHQSVIEAEVLGVAPLVALDERPKRRPGRPRKGSQPATGCLDSSPAQPESP